MDLRILVREMDVKRTSNYFVMVQFEEVTFPSKKLKSHKFRTNICANSNSPRFTKNLFLFEKVGLGNRLTLKLGVFAVSRIDESLNVEDLIV